MEIEKEKNEENILKIVTFIWILSSVECEYTLSMFPPIPAHQTHSG